MMWKRNRKESSVEATEVTKEETPDNSANVPLPTGTEQTIWNLDENPVVVFNGETAEAYASIEAHVAKHTDLLDFFVFDLKHGLLKEGNENRLALTESEAWDLSVALVQELEARKEDSEDKFKKIIVVVNNTSDLLNNENPEHTEQYMQFREYMQIVEGEGGKHGIHVLYA